ncbi:MAG: prepilin-type N-terminal cleavage/methylation domain-containing protein [Candidatus Hydrogenedentes bacterium]|nr:prepilin-type N-terminal cleavage/methylation domain-containing protein [Candidatus Hydrogenedentota bacterium]
MKRGFTLLEVMISVAIMVLVVGVMYLLADSMDLASRTQEAQTTTLDNARMGMWFLVRELRGAGDNSFTNVFPGGTVTYRKATDLDGNGTPVDSGGNLELGTPRTLQVDTAGRLVLIDGATTRVITGGVAPNEDANGNGALDAGEDANNSGRLERGLWFERDGTGIRITVEAQRNPGPRTPVMITTITETVVPRN